MSVTPATGASLKVTPAEGASLKVTLEEGSALTVNLAEPPVLKVTPVEGASLAVGEVCSVSPGTIVVLAASDGPLRTRDGGYLLLNPATNPPEN
jgi:hypothetical protein